jgi:hypothetical protein
MTLQLTAELLFSTTRLRILPEQGQVICLGTIHPAVSESSSVPETSGRLPSSNLCVLHIAIDVQSISKADRAEPSRDSQSRNY